MPPRPRPTIEPIAFAPHRVLPIEVLTLRSLHARKPRDLTRPERPDFHIVFLVTEGAGWHTVDFVRHRLARGQLAIVRAGQVQQYSPRAEFDARMLVFRPDAVRWHPAPAGPVLTPSASRHALAVRLFDLLTDELGPGGGRSVTLAARLVDALGEALTPDTGVVESGQALVDRFQEELEKHVRRAHEVAAYAALLRCTTKTLTRHCLARTGRTPKALIDARVALEARRSLAHEDGTVADLAAHLGYGTPTQFVKFFRRVTGETPMAFRTRVRRRL